MAKLRSDSTFARLPADVKERVDDMLMCYAGLQDVQTYLDKEGVAVSQTAIANYYQTHLLPIIHQRANGTAEMINQLEQGDLDDASYKTAKQRLFDLMTTPGANPKVIKLYHDMIAKATAQRLEARRLELDIDKWQRMAAQALLDQALSPEVQAIVGGSVSNEDKIAQLRLLLFGNPEPTTPTFVS